MLLTVLAVAVGCSDDGPEQSEAPPTTTRAVTTTAAPTTTVSTTTVPATTVPDSVATTAPPSTTTAAVAVTTAPPSTTVLAPTTTAATTTTTTAPTAAGLAEAADLVGTLSLDAATFEPGAELTVSLTVTNVSGHPVALEDRGELRFLAVRASIDGSALDTSYLWLGDTDLGPGDEHTMSRSWTPALSAEPGEEVEFHAVIAESVDSFNRAQNTVGVVTAVPSVVLAASG